MLGRYSVGNAMVCAIALAPAWAIAAGGTRPVYQSTGDYGININDSPGARVEVKHIENHVVIESPSLFVAKAVLESYSKDVSEAVRNNQATAQQVAALREKVRRYEALYNDLAAHAARTQEQQEELDRDITELRTSVQSFEADQELWQSVLKRLEQIDELERRVEALERKDREREQAAEIGSALDEADVETAIDAYDYVRFENSRKWNLWFFGIASVGTGRVLDGGTAGYFQMFFPVASVSKHSYGVGVSGGVILTTGAASISGTKSFFFASTAQAGPWLRLGGTNNLRLEANLEIPAYQYVAGHSEFPLLGASGRISFRHEPASIGLFYERSFNSVRSGGPDISTAGVDVGYVGAPDVGPTPLDGAYKTKRYWWSLGLGTMSADSVPTGGLCAGGRMIIDQTYYPNTRSVGVGLSSELSGTIGQDKRATDADFLMQLGYGFGFHVRLSTYLQIRALGQLEFADYWNAKWKFFLPGVSAEVTLFDVLALQFTHVQASWRYDDIGDYGTITVGLSKLSVER